MNYVAIDAIGMPREYRYNSDVGEVQALVGPPNERTWIPVNSSVTLLTPEELRAIANCCEEANNDRKSY